MRAPPFSSPPDFVGESVRVWFTNPAGIVTWFPQDVAFSNADAKLLVDNLPIEFMDEKYDGKPAFLFLHDWGGMRSMEDQVRPLILGWGRSYPRARIRTFHVRMDETSGVFARMAVSAGALTLSVAGYDMHIVDDFDAVLAKFQVTPLTSPD